MNGRAAPARWIVELLGLPADPSVGFVTGCQAANTVGLAAGRHDVLARAGGRLIPPPGSPNLGLDRPERQH
jgi:hypothetical protein